MFPVFPVEESGKIRAFNTHTATIRGVTGVIKMPTLSTVNQFTTKQPAFTLGGIRALIFNEHQNGLKSSGAIVRIGRKVLIDEAKFFAWILLQNKAA
jgi:hypothetical protein